MHEVIWSFLNVNIEEGRIVTARLDAKFVINILRGLGPFHLDASAASELLILLNHITDLYEDRNMIAHGKWGTLLPDKLPAVASLKAKGEINTPPSEVIIETYPDFRMIDILRKIAVANNAMIALRDAHETSHGRPPPRPPKRARSPRRDQSHIP
jgi:hypothetical protein